MSLKLQVVHHNGMINIDTKGSDGPGDFTISLLQSIGTNGPAIGVQFNPIDGVKDEQLDRALRVLGDDISNAITKYNSAISTD